MVGFIAGIPIKVCIYGTDIELAEIDFLCVKKEYRDKRLAPLLIQEVSRRSCASSKVPSYVRKGFYHIFKQ